MWIRLPCLPVNNRLGIIAPLLHRHPVLIGTLDYRIPQMLHTLDCLLYSPPLENHIRQQKLLEAGSRWELELRGCSIWAVELIVRSIKSRNPTTNVNSILVDFFLYDTLKDREKVGQEKDMIPHHRTRSIWY